MGHPHEYIIRVKEKLQQLQTLTRQSDREDQLLFATGDMVWLRNRAGEKEATLNYNSSSWDPTTKESPTPIAHIWWSDRDRPPYGTSAG